ncbi:hypothetical protein SEA_KARHDO_40 [Mycobacterium phage Karhdo]|nr:hypothetical protein SEA_KARHDO_40 [Mycobacterium phage Karhdo]
MRPRNTVPEPERTRLLEAAAAAAELPRAVRAANQAGGSVREIAALIGKSTNTIQRWLKEQQ